MNSLIFTHKGKREINQDLIISRNINASTYLLMVVDGMGGHEKGEIASQIILESISTYLSTRNLVDDLSIQKAINKANLAIKQFHAGSNSMGATAGGLVIQNNKAKCFWVGDVKILHFRGRKLEYETHSHSLINEIIENGSIVGADRISKYRHIVTRSIHGDIKTSGADIYNFGEIDEDDLFMVCSDGVHDILDALQIQKMLEQSTSERVFSNIKERLLNEAKDNFSIGLVF